ncbi:MAG TPA: RNA polymerase sigma factor, partial [Ohtaekwangia sp.]|uniref:RNA polymerase sigma factor n=1 Tax=Ohtaekwangia sp. TaxID=2066019 RepID=UPI002F935990
NREAQKALYEYFYGYAMSVCLRYSKTREEAKEILNDGFMKFFTHVHQHDEQASAKSWLRKIMINTAIDHYRKNNKHYHHQDIENIAVQNISTGATGNEQVAYEDLIALVQKLPDAYRAVFNLYVIDGFSHEEIAEQLGIVVGTSKSNLFKAREHLKNQLRKININSYAQYF